MLTPIPHAEEFVIKDKFAERYRGLLGERYDEFIKYSLSFLRKSIRVNTLKMQVPELKKRLSASWRLDQVPWCPEGFWVEHTEGRRDVGNLLEHALGYIYVQDAASMVPVVVLDPQPGERALDLCAAPGSKTTQIAQAMQNTGALVCNDVTAERISPLSINLQRCGVMNAAVTLMHGTSFSRLGMEFDRVLVDAPCSGTGTIRKSPKTFGMWNPLMVRRLAATQKKLIETGFACLAPGGTMVYSTCTLEPEEDEGVVDHLLRTQPDARLVSIELPIVRSEAVLSFDGKNHNPELSKCLRIWPQDNDTEGFFVAKITKVVPQ